MYKVFIKNKSLIILSLDEYNVMSSNFKSSHRINDYAWDVKDWFAKINECDKPDYYYICEQPIMFFAEFSQSYNIVHAAGALVKNGIHFLMIERNEQWDLPKGKQEAGESTAVTAYREVLEETGVLIKVQNLLCQTYHMYELGKKIMLKYTTWYWADMIDNVNARPQLEEGISKIDWVTFEILQNRIAASYPSLGEVCDSYKKLFYSE